MYSFSLSELLSRASASLPKKARQQCEEINYREYVVLTHQTKNLKSCDGLGFSSSLSLGENQSLQDPYPDVMAHAIQSSLQFSSRLYSKRLVLYYL
mmetsp:Transcript_5246/g.16047  ORF Transcript_5246/g.16047 Transcript_5246/m.16047 type:complete len:96 (-) Transcript_5246:215-502(-)